MLLLTGHSLYSQQQVKTNSVRLEAIQSEPDTTQNLKLTELGMDDMVTDSIPGDYNGDGKMEYMWLEPPKVDKTEMDCTGDCTSYIRFSDPKIPSIEVKNCISGVPKNEGDLNHNKTDEVGLLPGLFTSCWSDYHVWTLIKGEWVNAVKPFPTHCNQWDADVKPIEIDPKHKGFVIISFSTNNGTDILTETKSEEIVR